MKVTFTLKNLSDYFYTNAETGLFNLSDKAKFEKLNKCAFGDLKANVSMKIGTGNAFRDRVELNLMLREACTFAFKLEPRKGYRLATFEITKT